MTEHELKEFLRKHLKISVEMEWGRDGYCDPMLQVEIGLSIDGVTFQDVKLNIQTPDEMLNRKIDN